MVYKEKPFLEVDYNGKKIKFDKEGIYETFDKKEISFLSLNYYAMPRKMEEVYYINKSKPKKEAPKKVVKKEEPKKDVESGDHNISGI